MPRSNRAPSFQFFHADHLADPAVSAMSFDEQGRYVRALCLSWQTDQPGVAHEDQWRRWLGYNEADWPAHRDVIAAAFKVGRSGTWTQKRTVETRAAQIERQKTARKGASATNEKRWGFVAQRTRERRRSDSLRVTPSSSSSSSDSSFMKEKKAVVTTNGNTNRITNDSILDKLKRDEAESRKTHDSKLASDSVTMVTEMVSQGKPDA